MNYRSTDRAVYPAKDHLIWCPRYRRRVLGGRVDGRLRLIIIEAVQDLGDKVIEIEVIPDDVHLLIELAPTVWLSKALQVLEGRSSRRLRAESPHLRRLPSLQSPSWLVSTLGGAPREVVRRYVVHQRPVA
ncbi:MAG TPA: IS200/IS605 family transposase [Acidimicrobiales bacterium]|nr:IS200/IS605 family transposase [Acidimicrobiales bacterium]